MGLITWFPWDLLSKWNYISTTKWLFRGWKQCLGTQEARAPWEKHCCKEKWLWHNDLFALSFTPPLLLCDCIYATFCKLRALSAHLSDLYHSVVISCFITEQKATTIIDILTFKELNCFQQLSFLGSIKIGVSISQTCGAWAIPHWRLSC